MILILFIALCHLAGAWLLVTHGLRPARTFDFPRLVLLIATAGFYGAPVFVGWATTWISPATASACALAALGGGVLCRWKRGPNPDMSVPRLLRGIWRSSGWAERCAWLIIAGFMAVTFLAGLLLPWRTWDALGYHAASPIRWAHGYRFVLDSFGDANLDDYRGCSETYANIKAVFPFLVLALTGREEGVALTQWTFLPLLLASILTLVRQMGLPRWTCGVVSLFCLFAPEVALQSCDLYADVALLAATAALLAGIVSVWQEGPSRGRILTTALAFALVTGLKPVGLTLSVSLGIAFLGATACRCVACGWKARAVRVAAALGCVLAVCLAIAGPWYVHAWRKFGNPLYPIHVHVGSRTIFTGPVPSDQVNRWSELYSGKKGLAAWWHVALERERVPVFASWNSGLGAHFFVIGIPSLLIFLVAGLGTSSRKLLWPFIALFALVTLGSPTRVVARLILYQSLGAGLAFAWILANAPKIPRALLCLFMAFLCWTNIYLTVPAMLYRMRPPELFCYALLSGHRSWMIQDGMPEDFTTEQYWREITAKPGDVLAFTEGVAAPLRPLERKASMVRVPKIGDGETAASWALRLRALGATHLIVRAGTREFDAAESEARTFSLIVRRIDSGAVHNWFISHRPDTALYRIGAGDDAR